jgi:hypothetical protein
LVKDRDQPGQHCREIALRIADEDETWDPPTPMDDQIAEIFVFCDQSSALVAGQIENYAVVRASRRVPYRQYVVAGAAQSLDQTVIQAFVGDQPHAASGWPNSISSLRR